MFFVVVAYVELFKKMLEIIMPILCYKFVDLNNKVLNTSKLASKLCEGWMLVMDGN